MKDFKYLFPKNVKEACTFLSQYPEEAKIIAGGQSLLILLKQMLISPSYLIDIKGLSELDYIRYDEKDGLRLGALTTHRALETSPVVRERFFMLADMEKRLASVQIRNWGTLGGNLCHGDPASDLAPPLIALGAEVKLISLRGERIIKGEEFFRDYYETVLEPDEILAEVHVPVTPRGGGIYLKMGLRETDMALAGVATFLVVAPKDHEVCEDIRIVMGSVASTPPIPRSIIEKLLHGAIEAPSSANMQPWEFVVVSGEERERLGMILVESFSRKGEDYSFEGDKGNPFPAKILEPRK